MMSNIKDIDQLTPEEFTKFPIWEFLTDRENISDMLVQPISDLPVRTLAGRLVGTTVKLANGSKLQAMIGNVNLKNPLATRHFLSLAVWIEDHWFHLARYHDADWQELGPDALAAALEMPITEVFPVTFDISRIADGAPGSCIGTIDREPDVKLTAAQRWKLAIRV